MKKSEIAAIVTAVQILVQALVVMAVIAKIQMQIAKSIWQNW